MAVPSLHSCSCCSKIPHRAYCPSHTCQDTLPRSRQNKHQQQWAIADTNSLEYHYLQILVHRPWTSRRLQPIPAQGPGFLHARRTCIASASEIARLLCNFEERFGFQRLDVETSQLLPSAALILIFASISVGKRDADTINGYLSTLFRALDSLSNVYVSARMHLDSLLSIQQQWCAVYDHRRQQKSGKKRNHDRSASLDPARLGSNSKRARPPR